MKKAVQHTRYNIVFFQVYLISPISCWHVTRISRHSVSWMNGEAFTILNPRSFVGIFWDYGSQNTEKSVSLTDSDNQASQEGEESQNTERKTESYSNSVALVMAFLAAENENRQLKDFPQADFDRIPERFLLSVGTNSITDNFVYWKLRP